MELSGTSVVSRVETNAKKEVLSKSAPYVKLDAHGEAACSLRRFSYTNLKMVKGLSWSGFDMVRHISSDLRFEIYIHIYIYICIYVYVYVYIYIYHMIPYDGYTCMLTHYSITSITSISIFGYTMLHTHITWLIYGNMLTPKEFPSLPISRHWFHGGAGESTDGVLRSLRFQRFRSRSIWAVGMDEWDIFIPGCAPQL